MNAGKMLVGSGLIFILSLALTACSSIGKKTLQGTEHFACSQEIHFINHSVVCEKQRHSKWVTCQLTGSIVNDGTVRGTNVNVSMEFGDEIYGVRSYTLNLLGDLDSGERLNSRTISPTMNSDNTI
jgi:hypothetical protein